MSTFNIIIALITVIVIGLAVYAAKLLARPSAKPKIKPKTSAITDDALWQQLMKKKLAGQNVDKEMDIHLYGRYYPEDHI